MISQIASLPLAWHATFAAILGLIVGSFLNVVILRLPKLIKYQWSKQAYEWLNDHEYSKTSPPSIARPASHCPNCKTSLRPWQNIPIISFVFLKGRCANCQHKISIRYPLVEIMTCLLSVFVVIRFGFTLKAGFALILTWALIALSFIDLDHKILPDDIVLPLLWLGMLVNIAALFTDLYSSVLGAIFGYLSLWTVYFVFKLLTKKEGIGHGDFKLLAMLGAWLGWQSLPQIILVASVIGSLVGITMIIAKKATRTQGLAFGPYLAMAGWLALIFGEQINHSYLKLIGV